MVLVKAELENASYCFSVFLFLTVLFAFSSSPFVFHVTLPFMLLISLLISRGARHYLLGRWCLWPACWLQAQALPAVELSLTSMHVLHVARF